MGITIFGVLLIIFCSLKASSWAEEKIEEKLAEKSRIKK